MRIRDTISGLAAAGLVLAATTIQAGTVQSTVPAAGANDGRATWTEGSSARATVVASGVSSADLLGLPVEQVDVILSGVSNVSVRVSSRIDAACPS